MVGLAYDVETFMNVFSMGVSRVDKEEQMWFRCKGRDSRPKEGLKDFLHKIDTTYYDVVQWISYNGHGFDDHVINYILLKDPTVHEVWEFAQSIIRNEDIQEELRFLRKLGTMKSYDLLKIFNTVDRVSLKAIAISLNWPLILDLPFSPYEDVPEDQMDTLLRSYNINDCDITAALYNKMYGEIQQRYNVSAKYNIHVYNASQSVMGASLIKDMYCKASGMTRREFDEGRTYYREIQMADVVSKDISFVTPKFKRLYDMLTGTTFKASNGSDITKQDAKFTYKFMFGKTRYTFAMGGLHSEHPTSEMLLSTPDRWMYDADVKSYYPNMIIKMQTYPKHLGKTFLDVYTRVVEQRMASKDKIEKYALKIAANAIFGKMGSDKEAFYDRFCLYRTTINGQLLLCMLIEQFEQAGIQVFYANTDGVTVWLTPDTVSSYNQICDQWQQTFGLILEFANIEKALMRDVNNYTMFVSESPDGPHFKEKGEFKRSVSIGKRPTQQIVAKAIHEHFYNGVPLEQAIRSSDDIFDYAISQKIGGTQTGEYHYIKMQDGLPVQAIEKTQKENRFYACNVGKGGRLYKNRQGSLHNMLSLSEVRVINDLDENFDVGSAEINYNYYLGQARRLMSLFNQQTQLF